MVVSPSNRISIYNPVVETSRFQVEFPVFGTEDLRVTVDGAETGAYSLDATFSDGRSDDAYVELASPVSGVRVIIEGAKDVEYAADLASSGPDFVKQVGGIFSRLTAMIQENAWGVSRAPKLDPESTAGEVFLPDPVADRALVGREDGKGWENGPTTEQIEQAVPAAEAALAARDELLPEIAGAKINAAISEQAAGQAVAAADASGDVVFFDTKADADAALAGLLDEQIVEVMEDEGRGDQVSRYRASGGVFDFKYHPRAVLPYIDARDFGVVDNGLDVSDGYLSALQAGVGAAKPVKLPQGELLIEGDPQGITLTRDQKLTLFSDGNARLFVDTNLYIEGTVVSETTLAVDASQYDIFITVADASGIEVGDLLHIDTDSPVETGWRYHKQCVRRAIAVIGNVISLDQALDFWFTTAEATTVAAYAASQFHSDGIEYEFNGNVSNNDRKLALRFLTNSTMTNGLAIGQEAGWNANWTDGIKTISCDDMIFDRFNFEKLRYGPQITTGSRFTQVKNCYAKEVRHLDANNWAQDILFENIQGISTDGIIQCHPCIRPTWRNVHDSVTREGLFGIDLRGLGETVENCSTHSVNGEGTNTNSIVLNSDYADMAATFTRTVKGLRSPYAGIRAGNEKIFIVENSHVLLIDESQYTQDHSSIYVDDLTTTVATTPENFDPVEAGSFSIGDMRGTTARVVATDGYRTRVAKSYIDGITQANPAVVETVQAHNLETGDVVDFSDVVGMTELNGNSYTVTVLTDYTVSLDSTDSSGYTAYSSGGVISLQTANTTVTNITQAYPAVITAAGHGLSDGDIVWLDGVSGMGEISKRYIKVSSATSNTFEAQTVAGVGVDATGYSAYTSGGVITRQESVAVVDAATKPQCGILTGLSLRSVVFEGNENGIEFRRIPVKYRAFDGGNVDQKTRFGTLTVTVTSNVGKSVAKHDYTYDAQSGLFSMTENYSTTINSSIATNIDFAERHYIHEVRDDEGSGNWLDQTGARHYFTFDVLIDMTSSARFLNDVVLDFEEYQQGSY